MNVHGIGAVVTGASRGLGAALAKELARAGARVVLVARGKAELEEVASAISRDRGVARVLAADVADKEATYAIAGSAAALVGPVDLVVHNASTLGPVPLRSVLDTDCEDLERAFAVNVVGPMRLTKALCGPMILRRRGLFVNVSSDAAVSAYPRWGAYGASKAALDHLGRIFAAELEGTGVRVVSIDPGEMDTRMHADAIPDADRSTLLSPDVVAQRIVAIIRKVEALPTGARLEAAHWEGLS
jgi:NAD(P)-dependent dehydrogenase (short-subunit alcohol dehydrogenase family)